MRTINAVLVLIGSLLLMDMRARAQTNLPSIVPPSPQTQELNKYIDFPVDLSTGVPEISIPLYTIKAKGIEIPISLNYHASGIKNGQDDGDVGVGWSLSCNYRVSRTIYGLADTESNEMSPSSYQNINSLTNLSLDKYLSRFVSDYQGSANPDTHLPPRSGSMLDGEYDHFSYMVPGQSGKFIISDRTNKVVNEFSFTTNKLSYIEGTAANNLASGVIGFSLKDGNQNVFSFGEQLDKLGAKVLETNNGALNLKDITAWALTDIDTRYGEKIKFAYTNKDITSKYTLQTKLTVAEPRASSYDVWEYSVDDESYFRNYSVFSLSSITTQNERINFVNLNPTGYAPKKIQQINITDSVTGTLVKRIEFYYSENYFFPSGYTFLDSVKIFDKDLLTYEKYSFTYYDRDLPSSTKLVPDQWGYNKFGNSSAELLHIELGGDVGLPPGTAFSTSRSGTVYNNSGYGGYFANRKSNSNPSFFSLKTISYPTGGRDLFEYEPNKISDVYSGGIRIKAIKKFVSLSQYNTNSPEMTRYYHYGLNESGNGYSNYYLDHNDFRRELVLYEPIAGGLEPPRKRTIYSSTPLGEATQVTYYQYVTEKSSLNGKIVYFFSAVPNTPVSAYPVDITSNSIFLGNYSLGPEYISEYTEWQKPKLLKKEYFNSSNILLKKENYTYYTYTGQYFYGLKVRPFARTANIFNEYTFDYYHPALELSSVHSHGIYNITTGKDLLTDKSEVTYSGSDSIKVTTAYAYNIADQVIQETTVNSENQIVEKNTVYPADMPYDYIPSRMRQANDVNKVLEETIIIDSEIISQTKNYYDELSGELFVPNKISTYNTLTQLHEDDVVFHKYDTKGNIQEVSPKYGPITSYIWGYNSLYPVAKIVNSGYNAAVAFVNMTILNNPQTTDSQMRSELNNLRQNLPNAQVTTYTYKPLIGMTSSTDPKGLTTYYEYDNFLRLENIKDNNGDIIKNYKYNYQP